MPAESSSPAGSRVPAGLGRNHSATGGIYPLYAKAGATKLRKPVTPPGLESRRGLTLATIAKGGSYPIVHT